MPMNSITRLMQSEIRQPHESIEKKKRPQGELSKMVRVNLTRRSEETTQENERPMWSKCFIVLFELQSPKMFFSRWDFHQGVWVMLYDNRKKVADKVGDDSSSFGEARYMLSSQASQRGGKRAGQTEPGKANRKPKKTQKNE